MGLQHPSFQAPLKPRLLLHTTPPLQIQALPLKSAESRIDGPEGCLVPLQLQLQLFWNHCGVAFPISIIPLISLQQPPKVLYFAFFLPHWAKKPRVPHATQPVEKGDSKEPGGKQTAYGQCGTMLLSVLLPQEVWTWQRWPRHENWGGTATCCSLSSALLGPAVCQRRTSPSLPCMNGVRSPTSTVGSAHIRYMSLLLLASPSFLPSLWA